MDFRARLPRSRVSTTGGRSYIVVSVRLSLFAALLLLPPLQKPGSPDAALVSALEATCLAGRVEKCLDAGRVRLLAGEREAAAGLYAKACTGGVPEGCLGLATRYAGLAHEAQARHDAEGAAAHADKGFSLLRQARKSRPNMLEIAECEAWLCRLKASLARGREASNWLARARESETRAEALRQALGGGFAPDVFWRPPQRP
jgi:hypothetical protein